MCETGLAASRLLSALSHVEQKCNAVPCPEGMDCCTQGPNGGDCCTNCVAAHVAAVRDVASLAGPFSRAGHVQVTCSCAGRLSPLLRKEVSRTHGARRRGVEAVRDAGWAMEREKGPSWGGGRVCRQSAIGRMESLSL